MVVDEKVFEEKRLEVDFLNVFKQLSQMEWHSLIDAHRHTYLKGYEAGKAAGKRESLGSPEQSQ